MEPKPVLLFFGEFENEKSGLPNMVSAASDMNRVSFSQPKGGGEFSRIQRGSPPVGDHSQQEENTPQSYAMQEDNFLYGIRVSGDAKAYVNSRGFCSTCLNEKHAKPL